MSGAGAYSMPHRRLLVEFLTFLGDFRDSVDNQTRFPSGELSNNILVRISILWLALTKIAKVVKHSPHVSEVHY